MIDVVGAIIYRDGRYLLGQRPPGKSQAGKWEFIGGKIEPGESPENALRRECREELALEITNPRIRCSVVHEYPDKKIRLILLDCEPAPNSIPTALEHTRIEWWTLDEIRTLPLSPADAELLAYFN